VMGPGGGVDFVYKDEVRELEREYRESIERGDSTEAAAKVLADGRAKLTADYERSLLNPKEALALGSVSSIVMPGQSRRVLSQNLDLLMRKYTPCPMSGVQREHE